MRIIFSFLLFCCIATASIAQDLIVTIRNDSIFCKIDRMDDRFVYYRTPKTKRSVYELISKKEVREIQYNVSELALEKIEPIRAKLDFERIQVWGAGGFARMLNDEINLPEEFEEYYDKLRSGFFYSIGTNVYLNRDFGLGLVYSASRFSNSIDVINTVSMMQGKLSDNIDIQYVGVNAAFRFEPGNMGFSFQLNVGLGQSIYRNRAEIIYPFTLRGNGVGGHLAGEFQIVLGKGVFLPIHIQLKGFGINKLRFTPGEGMPQADEEELRSFVQSSLPVGISRLQIGAGLTIAF